MSGAGGGLAYYPGVECVHGFDACPTCDDPRPAGMGDLVRFRPNPGKRDLVVEARVVGTRRDPRRKGQLSPGAGWLETRDATNVFRSVRPSRVEVVERAK